ncbi:MAG: murein biosynthesis integral membrane protein MurJ [Rickettsiales bacterium]|nr:murein biosynthesis integral membrane protein MurJ [Rickettsiales bacterium]
MTMISRIFGFIRDVLIANTIGASWLSDAFFVAFKLPNFFRRLFAEGAFNAAFVPQFAGLLSTDGKHAAVRFASEALSVLLVALLLLNAVFLLFMPWLLQWFAPGFTAEPDKYDLTVTLARITFPYILFISLVSLLGGILNSLSRFAAVAAAPILLNFCLIGSLLFAVEHTETPAHALSMAVFVAGIVQLLWLLRACAKADALPSLLVPKLTKQVRRMLVLIAPAALGAGVAQINLLIDVVLASHFEDGVSYLYYADRLNELPIGVIGVAVGTALLPSLSKSIRSGAMDDAIASLNRAIELVLLFGIPACIALIVIPEALIRVLYEHGAFEPSDTLATYTALIAYAAGLPAFVLIKVLAPGFYAAEDTKTPFIIASICVVVNLVFNLILMEYYQHVGLAMATSIAGWLNVILMGALLYRRGRLQPDRALLVRVPKIVLCAAIMGAVLYYLNQQLSHLLLNDLVQQIIGISALVGSGLFTYGLMIVITCTFDAKALKGSLRRKQ